MKLVNNDGNCVTILWRISASKHNKNAYCRTSSTFSSGKDKYMPQKKVALV